MSELSRLTAPQYPAASGGRRAYVSDVSDLRAERNRREEKKKKKSTSIPESSVSPTQMRATECRPKNMCAPCLGAGFCYFFVAPLFFLSFFSSSQFLFTLPPVCIPTKLFPDAFFCFSSSSGVFFFVGFSSFATPDWAWAACTACWGFGRTFPAPFFLCQKFCGKNRPSLAVV